jgi:hypothetical protein
MLSPVTSSSLGFQLGCLCLTGELQEPSKKVISKAIEAQDIMVENAKNGIEDPTQQH